METCRYCLLNSHTLPIKKRPRDYRTDPAKRCTCLIQRRATVRSRNPNTNLTPFVSNIFRRPINRRASSRLRTRGFQQTKPNNNSIIDDNKDVAGNDCPICLETVIDEEKQRLSCSHGFHRVCINSWLENNNTCPVCRNKIGSYRIEARTQNITSRLRFLFSVANFSQSVTSFILQSIDEQLSDLTHYVYQ